MAEPLVLIPGLQSDHRSWVHQIHRFSPERPVLVPAGHHNCPTIAAMAAHVEPQLPRRFHLVAWSMGGYIALNLLPRIADRLASLILIATAAGPDAPDNSARRRARVELAEREGMRAANRDSMAFACVDQSLLARPELRAANDAAAEIGLDAYRTQQEAIIARPDARPRLKAITCPTLIIVGAKDRVTPPANAHAIKAGIAHAHLHVIPDCGHCPPLEKPDLVNGLMSAFIESAETADTV